MRYGRVWKRHSDSEHKLLGWEIMKRRSVHSLLGPEWSIRNYVNDITPDCDNSKGACRAKVLQFCLPNACPVNFNRREIVSKLNHEIFSLEEMKAFLDVGDFLVKKPRVPDKLVDLLVLTQFTVMNWWDARGHYMAEFEN